MSNEPTQPEINEDSWESLRASLTDTARSLKERAAVAARNAKDSVIIGVSIILAAIIIAMASGGPRYQIAAGANHTYVLDTKTGQVWQHFASSGSGINDPDFARPK